MGDSGEGGGSRVVPSFKQGELKQIHKHFPQRESFFFKTYNYIDQQKLLDLNFSFVSEFETILGLDSCLYLFLVIKSAVLT